MTSTKFKALTRLSYEQAIEKAKIKEKYSQKGDLIKLLINRKNLNEQLEKVLQNQKINRIENDYNNLRRKLFNDYKDKFINTNNNKTAQLRAHHLTNFLYNYLINSIQSGTLNIDYLIDNNEIRSKFNFQISKILLKSDLNYLYIYWFTSIDDTINKRIEDIYLPKLGNQIRYLLTSNRVIGYVPPIKFIRDTSRAMLEQLDDYLKNIKQNEQDKQVEEEDDDEKKQKSNDTNDGNSLITNIYGIDHNKILNQLNINDVIDDNKQEESNDLIKLKDKYEKSLKAFKIHNLLKKEKESKSVFMAMALNELNNHTNDHDK